MTPDDADLSVDGAHPSEDELADLLAETLDEGTADYLTAHVVDCVRCARLLADAERATVLVRGDGPEPMPAAVMARLEEAFAAEVAGEARWAAEGFDSRRSPRTDPSGLKARPVVHERETATTGPKLLRKARGPQTTRRQAREEDRESWPDRLRARLPENLGAQVRARPILAAACSVLVLLLGGAVALQAVGGGSESGTASSASSAADGAALTQVTGSGTAYTAAGLAQQVRTLVADTADTEAGTAASAPGPSSAAASSAAPQAAADSASRFAATGNTTLLDPAALRACLQAIDAGDARPVAVDLGTYDGREAALIVLPGRTGGYEVWAVARDCRPGADGTMGFSTVE